MHLHKDAGLIYLETPRTASKATTRALKDQASFITINSPHSRLYSDKTQLRWGNLMDVTFRRQDWTVFTAIRNPFDILVTWCKVLDKPVNKGGILEVLRESKYLQVDPPRLYVHRYDVDGFIRFERLDDDLNEVLTAHGLEPVNIPKVNVTESRIGDYYSDYYDQEAVRWVREFFSDQLSTFNYGHNDDKR